MSTSTSKRPRAETFVSSFKLTHDQARCCKFHSIRDRTVVGLSELLSNLPESLNELI
jgi:hypothetical protein